MSLYAFLRVLYRIFRLRIDVGFESSRFGAWKCRVWNFVVWGLIKCQSGVGSIIRLYKAEGIRHLDLTVWTVHQKEDWSEQL